MQRKGNSKINPMKNTEIVLSYVLLKCVLELNFCRIWQCLKPKCVQPINWGGIVPTLS